jgi:hypothetical protein
MIDVPRVPRGRIGVHKLESGRKIIESRELL